MFTSHSTKRTVSHKTRILPRSIPTDVLSQFDMLLAQAMQKMERGQDPGILKPVYWDAILILRRTGIRFEDLIHLKELDHEERDCCLAQGSDGFWWLHIHRKASGVGKEYRIPVKRYDGVIEALYRQRERVKGIPSRSAERYLFRSQKGILKYSSLRTALAQGLAPYLIHAGQPYVITSLQFRHTVALEMIQQGIDIYTVKEFLGYTSLAAMDKYVLCGDIYRLKELGNCTTSISANLVPCPHTGFMSSSRLDARPELHLSQEKMKMLPLSIETLRRKPGSGITDKKPVLNQEIQESKEVVEGAQEGEEDLFHDLLSALERSNVR